MHIAAAAVQERGRNDVTAARAQARDGAHSSATGSLGGQPAAASATAEEGLDGQPRGIMSKEEGDRVEDVSHPALIDGAAVDAIDNEQSVGSSEDSDGDDDLNDEYKLNDEGESDCNSE